MAVVYPAGCGPECACLRPRLDVDGWQWIFSAPIRETFVEVRPGVYARAVVVVPESRLSREGRAEP